MGAYKLKLCCHPRQFPNVQDFSAANGSNVRSVEREQRNRPAFSGHELNFLATLGMVQLRAEIG